MAFMRLAAMLVAVLVVAFTAPAAAWNRSPATQFATLPAGATRSSARGRPPKRLERQSCKRSSKTPKTWSRTRRIHRFSTLRHNQPNRLNSAYNPTDVSAMSSSAKG